MKMKILIGVVFLVLIIAFASSNHGQSDVRAPAVGPKTNQVTMTQVRWTRGGFDTVMMLDFTIRNDNDFAVKDISFKCTHYGPSGTRIDSNSRTLYERIPAHSSISRQQFNMGFFHSQTSSSSCQVTDYVSVS
jgi:hypothetical protein